jgi:D-arabinose 1-dehydrogenase-like Zn-dependent alcohol dehydrogenase
MMLAMSTTHALEVTKSGPAGPSATMRALVYHGPGRPAWESRPRPIIQDSTDAIVRITTSTICGTDLHILKGDLAPVTEGRILGHEGIGVIEEVGSGVSVRDERHPEGLRDVSATRPARARSRWF